MKLNQTNMTCSDNPVIKVNNLNGGWSEVLRIIIVYLLLVILIGNKGEGEFSVEEYQHGNW